MMKVQIEGLEGPVTVVTLSNDALETAAYSTMMDARQQAMFGGSSAVLFDLGAVSRIASSGLGAMVELAACLGGPDIAFCGLSADMSAKVRRLGLDHALQLYPDRATALENPLLTRHRLTGLRAVVLAAGKGTRAWPLTDTTPKALFDILGAPVLVRILRHLAQAGVGETIVNTGHFAPEIAARLRGSRFGKMPVFLSAEGVHSAAGWQGIPLGSATTLGRLQVDGNLGNDTLVICADALFDIDIAAFYAQHSSSGADVTIATASIDSQDVERYEIVSADETGRVTAFQQKPSRYAAQSTLANTGIYLFSARALALADPRADMDINAHLLPAVLKQGLRIQIFDRPFQWFNIGCLRDYVRTLGIGLAGRISGVVPSGTQVRGGVWTEAGASVAQGAVLHGQCHIGKDAEVCAGAELHDTVIIGERAVIEGPSIIRSSVILPGARVPAGSDLDHMIVGKTWSLSHTEADGRLLQWLSLSKQDGAASHLDWVAE